MAVVVDDNVVETFPPNGADQALHLLILPGRARASGHFLDPEGTHSATKPRVIDDIPVPQKIAWGVAPRDCLDDLLTSPTKD